MAGAWLLFREHDLERKLMCTTRIEGTGSRIHVSALGVQTRKLMQERGPNMRWNMSLPDAVR
jgi:hypothetical protein